MAIKTSFIAAAAAAVLGTLAAPAMAQVSLSANTFNVKITIQGACDVTAGSASDINLGTVPSTATNVSSDGKISVTCTKDLAYQVALTPSSGNTDGSGTMTNSGNSVAYALYQDRAHATPWGNVFGSNTVSGLGNGAAQSLTTFAKAPSANSPAGTYNDVVTVTLKY